MSEAYASTLNISFDVRGGLLMRQIHHWAADLFMAAIFAHMLRIFFTGAYRKPRDVNWVIGIVMLTLGMVEGLFGYSLPDDLLSGAGLRILEAVLQSIPIVGTYLAFFLFGGQFPGTDIIPRLYILHVLLIPGLLLGLISAHLFIMFHQKHTQMPDIGRTDKNVVGQPMYPYFAIKTGAFFFFVFGVLALLATVTQINPIWLYGPFSPVSISAGTQPDFYMGMLEGTLRIFPNWTWDVAGHTVAWNVLIPALVPLGVLFTGMALWPWIERWATGDQRRLDHLLHRLHAGRRKRPDRRPPGHPAVHGDLDRQIRLVPRPDHRLLADQADLPGVAAQGPGTARARGGDRDHPADAQRRVRGTHPPGLPGAPRGAAGQAGAHATAHRQRRGRERCARPGRQGPRGPAQAGRQPGHGGKHPDAHWQRARHERPQQRSRHQRPRSGHRRRARHRRGRPGRRQRSHHRARLARRRLTSQHHEVAGTRETRTGHFRLPGRP